MNDLYGTKFVEQYYSGCGTWEDLKAKARFVVYCEKDVYGQPIDRREKVLEGLHSDAPDPGECKICEAVGIGLKQTPMVADFKEGYQVAPNLESCKARIVLPESIWEPEWKGICSASNPPTVIVEGSFYGRERAGHDFSVWRNVNLRAIGFLQCVDVSNSTFIRANPEPTKFVKDHCRYVIDSGFVDALEQQGKTTARAELQEVIEYPESEDESQYYIYDTSGAIPHMSRLVAYVDDIECFVNEADVSRLKTELRTAFLLPDENFSEFSGSTFLGCERHTKRIDEFKTAITWSQVKPTRKIVAEFKEEAKKHQIKVPNRKTPLPVSDQSGKFMTREEDEAAAQAAQTKTEAKDGVKGVFDAEYRALHYVNAVAYSMRLSRPDLMYAVWKLQSQSADWSPECDSLLAWLMGYLAANEKVLEGVVDHRDFDVHGRLYLLLQTDASHAPCRTTRRSVAGYCLYLKGTFGTSVLLTWATSRLPTVTLSSMESELAALQLGMKTAVVYQILLNLHLGCVCPVDEDLHAYDVLGAALKVETDSASAIAAITNAGSGKARFTRRTVGTQIYWLHEQIVLVGDKTLSHKLGTNLSADAATKSLDCDTFKRHTSEMGVTDSDED